MAQRDVKVVSVNSAGVNLITRDQTPARRVGFDDDYWGQLIADPEWRWEAPAPDDWRPTIERAGPDNVAVMFFTTSARGRFHITRHVDFYKSGSLRSQSTEHTIAEGPPGIEC